MGNILSYFFPPTRELPAPAGTPAHVDRPTLADTPTDAKTVTHADTSAREVREVQAPLAVEEDTPVAVEEIVVMISTYFDFLRTL